MLLLLSLSLSLSLTHTHLTVRGVAGKVKHLTEMLLFLLSLDRER
jgi:hypothetical protein